MGSFAVKPHGCFRWSIHSSLPTCLPSNQEFSSSISIKQIPARTLAGWGGRETHLPVPSPTEPPEPKGWSRQGWEKALPP